MRTTSARLTAAAALAVSALGLSALPGTAHGQAPQPAGPQRAGDPRTTQVRHVRLHRAIERLQVRDHSHVDSYDRDRDFGEWITQHGECDTRAVVLIQESLKPVTTSYYCTVSKGRWYSYYNDRYYKNAYGGKVQIDHTVPVENAWISGAWRWTKATRVRYYNDLGDSRTLVAVDAHDNEVKSDQDPTTWLPAHGRCRYVRAWVAVKTRWHLSITAAEKDALEHAVRCPNTKIPIRPARVRYRG